MENMQVKVLGVSRYSFNDEKTGRLIEGCNVHFIEQKATNTEDSAGFTPKKVLVPYHLFNKFNNLEFPQLGTPVFEQQFGAKGVKTIVTDFIFKTPVSK